MDDDHLDIEQTTVGDERVGRITLDRPDKLNALPLSSVERLTERLDDIDGESVDAVVLSGRGKNFCAGIDLADMPDGDAVVEGGAVMHDVVEALRTCPVPVVTAVQGRAFGAGFMLCLGADVVLATENATFGLQEVNLGIPIAGYVTKILPRSIGEHRAREWLLTGREVSATEAERAGLVARVTPAESLDDAVTETLTHFETSSGLTIRLLKERLADPTDSLEDGEWAPLAERELADMRKAADEGDVEERLSTFRD
ncbi:enoyl-CoA hydratase/isomerase family protein [Natrinema caseinilyticum]|uniref:enoyl-CoA hydratase/isomerase family protein n=1 Tax=Natrinema caseinilyticum TaxID=2961570 RepID=UPI0020C23B40|nr:enoyl-CoA hydratase/isomerase family protein [Natrinema caseinilyticum]